MNKSQNFHWMMAVVAVFTGSLSISASAGTVFTDNTFDLANYTIDTYQSGGATISTSQTLTNGNPGAALQSIISEPIFFSTFNTTQVFMNNSFIYDPGTQGAIQSIDAGGDGYLFVQNLGGSLIRFAVAILSQNGNYYASAINTSPINGVWQSSSLTGLLASDFDLVLNPLTATTDPTRHPDYNTGSIQFGAVMITSSNTLFEQPIWDLRIDNLSYTVNAVPIPPALWLFGSGLLGLAGIAGRKTAA